MSRKDFELIARAMRTCPTDDPQGMAEWMADHLATSNPRFDRARFIEAATRRTS